MIQQILSIFTLVTIVSCSQPATLTENEKAIIIADVNQAFNDYHNDIRKSGLTAEFKWLDNSPEFFWVPPGYTHSISYDSVVAVLKRNSLSYKLIDNSFPEIRIIPLSRDLVTYTGRVNSRMTDTAGKIFTYAFIETGVLIKRSTGWKLLNGQTAVLNQ